MNEVPRPVQNFFFKFCGGFFTTAWVTFLIMLSHSFYMFHPSQSVFRHYQAISSHFIRE